MATPNLCIIQVYVESRGLADQFTGGVEVLPKPLAKTMIGYSAIRESTGQALVMFPGLVYPELAYCQFVENDV